MPKKRPQVYQTAGLPYTRARWYSRDEMDLRSLIQQHKLPCAVTIKQSIEVDKKTIVPANSTLLLHCVYSETRAKVLENDGSGKIYYVPLTSLQKFERLPSDSRLDDSTFSSVAEVIDSVPLPDLLRCTGEYYTSIPEQTVPLDDVIEVHSVQTDTKGERVLRATNLSNNQSLALPESMTACFSTMPCEDPVDVSEIIKLKMPQRVRIKEVQGKSPARYLTFQEVADVKYVFVTLPKCQRLLAIPCELHSVNERYQFSKPKPFKAETSAELGSYLNEVYRYCKFAAPLFEVGVDKLPSDWDGPSQPLAEILHRWLLVFESKATTKSIRKDEMEKLHKLLNGLLCQIAVQSEDVQDYVYVDPKRMVTSHKEPQQKGPPVLARSFIPVLPNRPRDSDNIDPEEEADQGFHAYYKGVIMALKGTLTKREREIQSLKAKVEEIDSLQERCKALEDEKINLINEVTVLHNKVDVMTNPTGYYQILPENVTVQLSPRQARRVVPQKQVTPVIGMEYQELGKLGPMPFYEELAQAKDQKTSNKPEKKDQSKLKSMTVDDVCDFLKETHLEQYCEKFREEMVDGALLLNLDKELMVCELGMKRLHALRLQTSMENVGKKSDRASVENTYC